MLLGYILLFQHIPDTLLSTTWRLSGNEFAMSDIANLQEAVETARPAYARASEAARSREHALSLIQIV